MTGARKDLFTRALAAAPGRLHFAAHSHHLWPDAGFEGQVQAWDDAARHADRKWDHVFGAVIPEAQGHVARELGLPDPSTLTFSSNTHDFLLRIFSGFERRPVRILSTDGEFHSFRRQAQRWEEAGRAVVERVPLQPFATFAERFLEAARGGRHDWIVVSHVFFRTGQAFEALGELADVARPEGPWVLVDGYHGFMARRTDLSAVADRIFYTAGVYKYAMSGEGGCFLHAPDGFCPRPVVTGWFAEFGDLDGPPGGVGYRADGGRFWGATFDVSALYRFNAARRRLDVEGLTTEAISAHATSLAAAFQSAVREGRAGPLVEAEILNPVAADQPARARFLALRHPQAKAWSEALLARNVVTDVRDDVIRFGFGLYQGDEDLDGLIAACAAL
ncbi:MAG TPA: class V aminotransferase [Brevundimonas sp.]|jgi:selenocysteine lyase/cysteine desulfurase|uniref:kynureninase/PvdN C-terminal domain-containing protein n=1 Tax=Brevundimonas sp. TaxID=1871086 RepID=UPI002DF056BD|nr:class V aminotransferase [Brevundimonas sp.]